MALPPDLEANTRMRTGEDAHLRHGGTVIHRYGTYLTTVQALPELYQLWMAGITQLRSSEPQGQRILNQSTGSCTVTGPAACLLLWRD